MTGLYWAVRTGLLLFCTLRLGRLSLPLWRLAATALFAALWQTAAQIVPVMQTAAMQAVLLAFELLLAFSCTERAVRAGILLVLLSFGFEAVVLALEHALPGKQAWIPAGGLLLFCTLVARPTSQPVEPVTVEVGERRLQLLALHDTGNTLRDPISGGVVLVADWTKAARLLPETCRPLLTQQSLEAPAQLLPQLHALWPAGALRLVPFHAVGTEQGLLLAVAGRLRWADGREEMGVIAFSPSHIGGGRQFEALAGGIA